VEEAVIIAEETNSTFNIRESCPKRQQSKGQWQYKTVHIVIEATYQILWEGKKPNTSATIM
jgi:hypothetical protein